MYGKINGKQIKDTTVDLLKLDLSGSQGTFLFGTGSYIGSYEMTPSSPNSFITKQYADSLSSGLDSKESVYLVAVGNITPFGTVSVDGVTASLGSRILLVGQSSPIDNGIYVVGSTAWSRSTDADGDPGNEVSLGNYTFIERGTTFSSTGWVLYDTNAVGSTVSVGIETQLWTQFNGAGSFIWGNGLSNTGNNIYVDIAPNSGLTFSSTQLTLANYVAGNGLTLTNGVLDVGAGTGISVGADTVSIANTGVAAGSYGNSDSVNTFSVNAQGQLTTVATQSISITSGQVSNFTASVQSLAVQVIAGTGITVSTSVGYATVSIANTGVLAGSYGAAGSTNTFAINAQGQVTSASTQSISITSGQVSNFTSSVTGLVNSDTLEGNGLTSSGGRINVGAGSGISVGVDTVSVDYATVASQLAGNGLTPNGTTIDVNTSNGLTVSGDSVQVASSIAGNGLAFSSGVIDINVVKGVTISGDALFSDAGTILTTSILTTVNIATNSTVQSALTAIDNYLNNVGAQQELAIANVPTGTFIKTVNAPQNVLGYTFSTASDGAPHIYINGIYVKTNATTASSPAYFSTNGGVNGTADVGTNSVLYLNPFVLGFRIDPTDDIVVHYLSRL